MERSGKEHCQGADCNMRLSFLNDTKDTYIKSLAFGGFFLFVCFGGVFLFLWVWVFFCYYMCFAAEK